MNLLQIGLTEKPFEYPKGSLVITDEHISDDEVKYSIPGRDGLNTLPMTYREARERPDLTTREKNPYNKFINEAMAQ
jgi:hypothetical protein